MVVYPIGLGHVIQFDAMIITSLLSSEKYFWIKIPRTATVSYLNFFLKYYKGEVKCNVHDPALGQLHTHYTYLELCNLYDTRLPGVTVVRHPLKRFVSGLHQLKLLSEEKIIDVSFLQDMDSCVNFLTSFFGKNCQNIVEYGDLFNTPESFFPKSFFQTQISYMYHPKVTWFKYENIQEFNSWIHNTLGYDTLQLTHENSSNKNVLNHLDFSDERFIKIAENMFYDDYKVLNYPFQYLT